MLSVGCIDIAALHLNVRYLLYRKSCLGDAVAPKPYDACSNRLGPFLENITSNRTYATTRSCRGNHGGIAPTKHYIRNLCVSPDLKNIPLKDRFPPSPNSRSSGFPISLLPCTRAPLSLLLVKANWRSLESYGYFNYCKKTF